MAIFALNVMPYISASIIVQLMGTIYPPWEKIRKEGGEAGRKQMNQYTRYLTVILALVQSFGIATALAHSPGVVQDPGVFFVVSTVATLSGGTLFLMWLGEQITARGGRQRRFPDHLRRHRLAFAHRHLPGPLACPQRSDRPVRAALDGGAGGRGDPVHRLYGAVAAPAPGAVSQAPGRQPHVWGRQFLPAAEAEHLRRDPADLRLQPVAVAGDGAWASRRPPTCRLGRGGCRALSASFSMASPCSSSCTGR